MPAWGWLATWLVGMSALVLLASEAVVPRVQARERGADQRLLEELHGTVASIITRPITLTVVERRVSLEGEVSSETEREALLSATREHEGVVGVSDSLSVAAPEDTAVPEAPALSEASPEAPEPPPARPPAPPSPSDASPAPTPSTPLQGASPAPDDVAGSSDASGTDDLAGTRAPVRFTVIDEFGEELLEDEEALALGALRPDGPFEPGSEPGSGPDFGDEGVEADPPPPNDIAPDDPFASAAPPAPPGPVEVALAGDGSDAGVGPDGPPEAPIAGPAPPDRSATLTLRVVGDALRFVGDIAADDERRLADVVGPATEAFDPSYVENTVQTGADVAPARWLGSLEALLVPLAGLDEPAVTVDADRLFVAGAAPDVTSRDAVLDAVARLFPDHALENRLTLDGPAAGAVRRAPDPATPFRADADEDAGARREALSAAFLALPDRNVLFESGTADFAGDSDAKLETIARLLDEHPGVRVEIEGHTDALGPARDNLALSQRRANAVRDALVAAGVERGRLVAYGYGEGVPIAENSTPEGRARNRRIEFRF